MKFVCNTFELCEAVTNVQRAVSSKAAMPVLEGILISTDSDKLILSGYDLEIAIKTTIPATIQTEGCLVLNARLFGEILKKVPESHITVESDEKQVVTIKSGNSEFSFVSIDANEYPELPAITDKVRLEMPTEMLQNMVSQTIFAASTSDIKPVHTGILFEIEDNNIRLIAVDGYRLAIRSEKTEFDGQLRFIVPAKTLSEILKLIGENDKTVAFNVGTRHATFEIGNFLVISRLLEGDFLDYKTAVPVGETATVTVNTREFINAIERISLLITDRLKSPVRCLFGNDRADMRCTTVVGKATDSIECENTGTPLEIGFNNKYFLDALRAADCDKVKIQLNGATAPIKIVPMEGESFLFLVLPVRLKSE